MKNEFLPRQKTVRIVFVLGYLLVWPLLFWSMRLEGQERRVVEMLILSLLSILLGVLMVRAIKPEWFQKRKQR
jgi:hypothetical protein